MRQVDGDGVGDELHLSQNHKGFRCLEKIDLGDTNHHLSHAERERPDLRTREGSHGHLRHAASARQLPTEWWELLSAD